MKYGWISLIAAAGIATAGCSVEKVKAESKGERQAVDLTVYDQDFAMVREDRSVQLADGRTKLHIQDVSKAMDPTSVLFSWPKAADAEVVANTYDLGVNEGSSLLSRYLGQEVEMSWRGEDGHSGDRIKGTLEVAGQEGTVVRTGNKLLVNPTGTIEVPSRPDVITIPQLSVDVDAKGAKTTNLGVAYLTRGLSWSADYVATLLADEDVMNVECWATVVNKTGTTFPEAKITLVAGSPNRSMKRKQQSYDDDYGVSVSKSTDNAKRVEMSPQLQVASPETVGELYSYVIKSKSSIAPDQMNRVKMLSSDQVPIKRDYSIALEDDYYYSTSPYRQNAQMGINLVNSEKSKLGMPLPKGAVRVYEPDSTGAQRYVGAGDLSDTPKDGKINLTLTNVFDIVSETRLVKTTRIDKRTVRRDYESVLSNAKKKDVTVRVVRSFYAPFKMAQESIVSTRPGNSIAQWMVPIPAGGKTTLKFSVNTSG